MDNTQFVRNAVNRYRNAKMLGLMKAVICIMLGILGLVSSLSGSAFNGATTQGSLVTQFGSEGAKLAGAVPFAIIALIGCIWAFVRIRDLTVGIKRYKHDIEASSTDIAGIMSTFFPERDAL